MPNTLEKFVTVVVTLLLLLAAGGCGGGDPEPVELFPEDMCGLCRMAVSDHRCAAEIITASGDAVKFDDIGCLRRFRTENPALDVSAVFVKNFEDRTWLVYDRAVVVETGIMTPMGTGLIAFADSARAKTFLASPEQP